MVTGFGGFSGQLDEESKVKDAIAFVPGDERGLTARKFRVRIFHVESEDQTGRVSAVVQGAAGALERGIVPEYKAIWDLRRIPELPEKFIDGTVNPADFRLSDCLPEIEQCERGHEARRLEIDPPVPSVGFFVKVSLEFTGLQPGTRITGVVALSDDLRLSPKRKLWD